MIVLNLNYSLGNQMFEYAYAKALSIFYEEELVINEFPVSLINFGDELVKNRRLTSIQYKSSRLKNLAIEENVKYMKPFVGCIKGIISVTKLFFLRKTHWNYLLHGQEGFLKLSKSGFYVSDDTFSYFDQQPCNKNKKELIGVFASPKYFAGIESIIKTEFKVKTEPSENNKKIIEEIKACNSICVHIRRGDYLQKQNTDLLICTEKYYKKAMKYIGTTVNNPIFYVFSNTTEDIIWVRENYKFNYPVRYIDLNNPDYEELRLMYYCKHFIISNSTFSWWASFLADNPDKIILAPDKWRDGYNGSFDCDLDCMVKISVD